MSPSTSDPPPLIVRARELIRDAYYLLVCAFVGALTGLTAIGFRGAVGAVDALRHHLISQARGAGHPGAVVLVTVAAPAIGGLLVGWLIYRLVRVQAGHGVPAVISAAAADRPMTDWKLAYKAGTSVMTIGSGGSAGPEGPIIELSAVIGSYAWKLFRLPGTHVRLMMGCAGAAGIAAIFNVPVGGVLFVLDVVLRDYSLRTMAPVMLASVAASTVNRYAGIPAFEVPPLRNLGDELMCAPAVGLMAGLFATVFIRANFYAADLWKRWPGPAWLRPAAGGACVGVITLAVAEAGGEGYSDIGRMLAGGQSEWLLLAIGLARVAATACTLGSGGTGGAFAPALVVGAACGAAVAEWLRATAGVQLDRGALGLAGVAGLIAGTFQAPLTAVIIAMNLSHWNSQLLVPLMLVTVISAWLTRHLARASIYDLTLLREGVDLQASRSLQAILAGRSVAPLVRRPVETVRFDSTLGQLLDAMTRTHQSLFPVLDAQSSPAGVIRMAELRQVLREDQLEHSLIAADLMQPLTSVVRPQESLAAAWELFNRIGEDELVVVDDNGQSGNGRIVVGLLRRSDVVRHVRWG